MIGRIGKVGRIGRGQLLGGAPAPLPEIPVPITIAPYASRSAIHNPPLPVTGVLTEVANDDPTFGGATVLQYTGVAATLHTIDLAAPLGQPVDMTGGHLSFAFEPLEYMGGATNLDRFSIQLHSAGTAAAPSANYHQLEPFGAGIGALKSVTTQAANDTTPGRKLRLGIATAQLTLAGTGANLAAINRVVITVRSKASVPVVKFRIGALRYQPNPMIKAAAIIGFDDIYASLYTTAFPLLQAAGLPFVIYPGAIQVDLGAPGRCTLAQLLEMQAAGAEIAYQAWTGENIAMTQADIDAMKAQYAAWGFVGSNAGSWHSSIGPEHPLALPYKQNFDEVRTHKNPNGAPPPITLGETYPPGDTSVVRGLNAEFTNPAGYLAAHIAQAKANKGVARFNFHNNLTNLPALIDLVKNDPDVAVTTPARLKAMFA